MRFVYPDINKVFDTEDDYVNELVIENSRLLYALLLDIKQQIKGGEGRAVLSIDDKVQPMSKFAELLLDFFPFEINTRLLLNKASAALERSILQGEQYQRSLELLNEIEKFLIDSSFPFNCDVNFSNITLASLIKACGLSFAEDHDSLCEKIIDYMELVREFDKNKLFITYNLRCIVSDNEMNKFLDTILAHGYHLIMIESSLHSMLSKEKRYIVDANHCEIC
ncbi:MAG: type II-A CRISPR-associated protein Csn2 [Coriobacteriia bacterium]|nr:type II-A CRISPR-associated protein Csn2 [Coriobacteriia bacterium]